MKDAPLVSIIVNNHNYGRFLRDAIDSALGQTYPYTEVVVVDDGSTDDSPDIIASYGDRIVPVLKENGGQGSAVNAGFAASQGELVVFLDADDYLFPTTVERMVAAWEPGVSQVQGRLKKVDAYGNTIGFYPPLDLTLDKGEVWRVLVERGTCTISGHGGLAFSRAALNRILPVPEAEYRRAVDLHLVTAASFYGRTNAIDEALGVYRVHGSNEFAFQGVPSIEWFSKLVHDNLKEYGTILRKASELGYSVRLDLPSRDYGGLLSRIVLLRLDPQRYPISSDHRIGLVYQGIRAVWRYSGFDSRRRLIHSAWFAWVGMFPLPIAKLAVDWLFTPDTRPRSIDWMRRKVRSLNRGDQPT
jgi:glycosyltransferase involved in cell wall biosynthesis